MEFDKSKVYTALNADEVKNGSMGYFAGTINGLRGVVEQESRLQYGAVRIRGDDELYRFHFEAKGEDLYDYNLFYLVEEPKEEKLRPYRDIEELKQDFSKRYNSYTDWNGKVNPMYSPLIWVKSKRTGYQRLITAYSKDIIQLGSLSICLQDLFEDFEYLDGTSCGIKED